MADTHIFMTQDAAKADQTAGFWKDLNYTVLAIGPTSPIEVAKADDESVLWEPQADGDWYCVVATKDAKS